MTVTLLPDVFGMLMRVNITRTNSTQYTVILRLRVRTLS